MKKVLHGRDRSTFLEPSAGKGVFYDLMPAKRRLGLDLEPKHPGVIQGDFFAFTGEHLKRPVVTVGNPPFGKNASLAVRFFNHAARFSHLIAFVVPMTFRKASVINRLDRHFELILDKDLPADAFEFEGENYAVPCCFQIWRRTESRRAVLGGSLRSEDFEFVTRERAHFAVRRVGALAGKVIADFAKYSAASHYFLGCRIEPEVVARRLSACDWSLEKANNAGNPSISKRELVAGYERVKAAERQPCTPRDRARWQ